MVYFVAFCTRAQSIKYGSYILAAEVIFDYHWSLTHFRVLLKVDPKVILVLLFIPTQIPPVRTLERRKLRRMTLKIKKTYRRRFIASFYKSLVILAI